MANWWPGQVFLPWSFRKASVELPENPYTNLPFSGEMFGTKEMWSSFDCDFEPRSFDGKPKGKWTGAKLTEKLPWGASVYLPWTFRLAVNRHTDLPFTECREMMVNLCKLW